jgi:uncharacterized membrane protein (DUF485 family)
VRRAHRSFAFPRTVAFVLRYLASVLLSDRAGGFTATRLGGTRINVALVLGLAQFPHYLPDRRVVRAHAAGRLDPKAQAVKDRLEEDA